MALDNAQIKTDYPQSVYNYRVEIADFSITFSEVSGLDSSYETTTATVLLKKGVVKGKRLPALYDWISAAQTNQNKENINIYLCDETGAPVIHWKVINAFLTRIDAPSFTADTNDATIESMELMGDSIV